MKTVDKVDMDDIYDVVDREGWVTAREVAESLGIKHKRVENRLKRWEGYFGLVKRESNNPHVYYEWAVH